MNYKGLIISDIHFGAMDSNKLLEELYKKFIEYMLKIDKLSFIIIAGDLFDHILYLNEEPAKNLAIFMDYIFDYAKEFNTKIRIVYGTQSHECNQYSIFFGKELNSNIDFKVINTVSEEQLFEDIKVLYLPEEYIYDKSEYYRDFFSKKDEYDYIFGHGVIQELMPSSEHIIKNSKKSKRSKPAVFNTNELMYCCHGEIYFGHYHIHTEIQDKVFYCGSFSRWAYGEEEPKGFYYVETDGENFYHKFIINDYAPEYTTITYGYDNEIFKSKDNLEKELSRIEMLKDNELVDNVRLVMNIPEDYPNASAVINNLSERFANTKNIKLKISNGFVSKNQKIDEEYLKETMEKYGFIRDKSMPINEQAHLFIEKKFDKEIDADRIEQHLKTKDILSLL